MKAIATFTKGAGWVLMHTESLTEPDWKPVATVEVFIDDCEVSIELPESKKGFVKFEIDNG
jgi:hypothetical protein